MLSLLFFFLSPLPLDEMELIRAYDEEVLYHPEVLTADPQLDQLSQRGINFSFAPPLEFTSRPLRHDRVPLDPLPSLPNLTQLKIPVTLNDLVLKYIDYFRGRGRYSFAKFYSRMGRYEELIYPILDRYQLHVR